MARPLQTRSDRLVSIGLLTARALMGPGYSLEIQKSAPCVLTLPHRRWHVLSFYPAAVEVCRGRGESHGTRFQSAGHAGIYPAGQGEAIRWNTETAALHLHLSPARITRDGMQVMPYAVADVRDPVLKNSLSALYEEVRHLHRDRQRRCDGLIAKIAQRVADAHSQETIGIVVPQSGIGTLSLEDVLDRMHGPVAAQQSLDSLSELAGVTPRTFSRNFSRLMGASPHDYLINSRVELVKHGLYSGRESAADLSVVSGFYDQAHMIRAFRSRVGLSPSEYVRHFSSA